MSVHRFVEDMSIVFVLGKCRMLPLLMYWI